MSCRLFVQPDTLAAGSRVVEGADYRYLFRVRRLRAGSRVVLFDGAGREAEATVAAVEADRGMLMVEPPCQVEAAPGCRLVVMPALIKGERMDWCVQKLVELGVSEIAPVQTARTVVKLTGERARRRHRRFEDIARDAARQCGRASLPVIREIADLDTALAFVTDIPLKLIPWTRERGQSLRAALPHPLPPAACVLIGPEGGFEPAEVERARSAGFLPVGLGSHILRAETAAMAVAAVFALATE